MTLTLKRANPIFWQETPAQDDASPHPVFLQKGQQFRSYHLASLKFWTFTPWGIKFHYKRLSSSKNCGLDKIQKHGNMYTVTGAITKAGKRNHWCWSPVSFTSSSTYDVKFNLCTWPDSKQLKPQASSCGVSHFGLVVSMSGWQADDVRFPTLALLSLQKRVVYDTHCSVTLPLIISETLKWLSLLPILTQNHSGSDSVELGILPPPPTSWDFGLWRQLSIQ